MSTRLTKPVERLVEIMAREWIVSFIPATPESRFDQLSFRAKGKRRGGPSDYCVPLESVRNFAAEKCRLQRISEKKRLRKLRKAGLA